MVQGKNEHPQASNDEIVSRYTSYTAAVVVLRELLASLVDQDDAPLVGAINRFQIAEKTLLGTDDEAGQLYFHLAGTLFNCYKTIKDDRLLKEAISLDRLALSFRPPGHPRRADTCKGLGLLLRLSYVSTRQEEFLNEAIQLQREALDSFPSGHTGRFPACGNLIDSLWMRYQKHGGGALMAELVLLEREYLSLCRPGHSIHLQARRVLAKYLVMHYQCNNDDQILDESINIQRELLFATPPGHPQRGSTCGNLGNALRISFLRTRKDNQILAEAIKLERECLSLHPPGHDGHPLSCENLAKSLAQLHFRTGDSQFLQEAIELQRNVVSLRKLGHSCYVAARESLAFYLHTCYKLASKDEFSVEAIDLQRECVSLSPPGHPRRGVACRNLAASLGARFYKTGDDGLITEAIDLQRESHAIFGPGHPDHAQSCGRLAYLLHIYFVARGNDALLNEAMGLRQTVLSLCPPGHKDHRLACSNLSVSLSASYRKTGHLHALDEALKLNREVLLLCPPGDPFRTIACSKLGGNLRELFINSGDSKDLKEAIALQREALSLSPKGHPRYATNCGALASSLVSRYCSTGDDRILRESIALHRGALSLSPPGHQDHALHSGNLADALRLFYKIEADESILIEAIDLERKCLALCPPGHPKYALAGKNLSRSLALRYKDTGDVSLLTEAIELQQDILSLQPPGHPGRAASCNNLANLLELWHKRTGDSLWLNVIRGLSEEGLCGSSVQSQWRGNLKLAQLHLHAESAFFDPSKAIRYITESLAHDPDDILEATSCIIGLLDQIWNISHDQHSQLFEELVPICQRLIRLLPIISSPALSPQSQLQALRISRHIGSDAFVNAALAGDWCVGLEDLEMVQGLLWSQRLHFRDPQLQDIPPSLAAELERCLGSFEASSRVFEAPDALEDDISALAIRDAQHDQVARVFALLREIRALPGLDRFMLGESYDRLCSAAYSHPVVVLVGSRGRAYALILTPIPENNSILALDWTKDDFQDAVGVVYEARAHRGERTQPSHESSSDLENTRMMRKTALTSPMAQGMRQLWVKIVKPIIDRLGIQPSRGRDRPRLHWCLTGKFHSLPVHAAGIYDSPSGLSVSCADYVVSSYTPTLATLLRIRKTMAPLSKTSSSLALVAEKRAQDSDFHEIPEVDAEVNGVAVIAITGGVHTVHRQLGRTTVSGTCETIKNSNMAHLACHGIQDKADVIQTGFCLGDGRLTISRLMDLKLENAFLAFLSACETAKGDRDQPDQVMHLAAAMLFTGFKSVIATMWAISDSDGPQVARWFYEELFANEVIDTDTVAYALDTAVRKLRESGVSIERWAPFIHIGA